MGGRFVVGSTLGIKEGSIVKMNVFLIALHFFMEHCVLTTDTGVSGIVYAFCMYNTRNGVSYYRMGSSGLG